MEPPDIDIHQLRDQLIALVDAHDAAGCGHSPPGETCWGFRQGLIAFFLHSIGLGTDDFGSIAMQLNDYNARCDTNCASKHRSTVPTMQRVQE